VRECRITGGGTEGISEEEDEEFKEEKETKNMRDVHGS
jgi:hypothetical protein